MRGTRLKSLVITLIIVIIGGLLAGCSKEAEKKPASDTQKKELPSELKSMRKEIDKLISQLEQTAGIMSQCPESEQSGGSKEEKSQQGSSKEQDGQGSQSVGQESSNTQGQWSQIREGVNKLHQNWNQTETIVVKEGLASEIRDGFENSLEELTINVDQNSLEGSLLSALKAYGYYPEMVQLFNSRIPAEYFGLKHRIMLIRYQSAQAKWVEAKAELPKLKTQWEILKKSEALQDQEISQRTENSLKDLESAVSRQESCLVQVKSDIAFKNLDEIEKKLNSSI
ncbi:MAG: hypothetical protein GX119_03400 [Syntrophomonadaceae bacterium]|nr:hypothetical protein [Syntrophomonadaceae bacterium]